MVKIVVQNQLKRERHCSESDSLTISEKSENNENSLMDVQNDSPIDEELEDEYLIQDDELAENPLIDVHDPEIIVMDEDPVTCADVPQCSIHRKECPFMCKKCKVHVCRVCIVHEHAKCPINIMDCFIRNVWHSALKEDQADIEGFKSKINFTQKSFQSKIYNIKMAITTIASRAMEHIEEKRSEILSRIEYIEKIKRNSWNYQSELCDYALRMLCHSLTSSEPLNFDSMSSIRENLFKIIGKNLTYIEDDNIYYLPRNFTDYNLGEIKTSVTPKRSTVDLPDKSYTNTFNCSLLRVRNHFDEDVTGCNYSVRVEICEENVKKTVYHRTENLKNGTYKIWYYPTNEGMHFLHVYLNDCPINRSPFRIIVNNLKTDVKQTLLGQVEESFGKPWGICTDNEGRVMITYRAGHCVRIYKESGSLVRRFGCEGSQPGQMKRPTGIAADRQLRRIIVADKDNHRIQVFNYTGVYLLHFGKEGEENGNFSYPWDVAVNDSSQIAVSDSSNRRIQLFDSDGEFINKFDFKEYEKQNIEMPRGLVFETDASMLITDFNKHKVISLKDMRTFVTLGSKGSTPAKFFRPQGIDIDGDGRFLVVDSKNNRVQVFNKNGEFLGAYGSTEDDPSQLVSPQCACFLPDGRIAITQLNGFAKIVEAFYSDVV
ncbi:UNVERIFIED_CONTAM: hypothetical protein PYX00_000426 [Menopon gallinae]|uniref:Uncharacterized protein n=1 Tax=Menopon gallinae TaxID=328185 RepID=A0AAW2I8H7_9NEOP